MLHGSYGNHNESVTTNTTKSITLNISSPYNVLKLIKEGLQPKINKSPVGTDAQLKLVLLRNYLLYFTIR